MSDIKLENNKEKSDNKVWIKILVPAVIVLIIIGIFIFKNTSVVDTGLSDEKNVEQVEADMQSSDGVDFSTAEFALDATENLDMESLLSYGLPVIIDFGADSCIPCKEMAPVLEELNIELRGKAIVKFVDVWKNQDASKNVPLRVIPTQFFFDKDGKPYVPSDIDAGFLMYQHQETGEHVLTAHEGGMTKDQILNVLKELGVK